MRRTCGHCGTSGTCAEGGLPEGWSFSVEGTKTVYMCTACARANLRAIEAKLPQDYWEY